MVAVEMVVLLDFWGEKVQIRGRWKGRGSRATAPRRRRYTSL